MIFVYKDKNCDPGLTMSGMLSEFSMFFQPHFQLQAIKEWRPLRDHKFVRFCSMRKRNVVFDIAIYFKV